MLAPETKPQAELWAMAHLGTPMAVRVAATLRIADHLAAEPKAAAEIADAVGADPGALGRLMRYLAARGVLSSDETGRFALTEKGQALRDDHPSGLRGWLDLEGAGRPELAFVHLLHSVRTGEAAFPEQFGCSLWEDLAANPEHAAAFNKAIGTDMVKRADDIAAAYDWGSCQHVVDVGGGNGSLLIALLRRHPDLRGTVVDMPPTAAAAREAIAAAGLADRGEAVAGNFLNGLPHGAGGYVLSLVTHNWTDDGVRAILRRCAEAMSAHGSVFVIEAFGSDGQSPPSGMDLRMLVYTGGRERSVSELAALGADVGLGLKAVHHIGPLAMVELA